MNTVRDAGWTIAIGEKLCEAYGIQGDRDLMFVSGKIKFLVRSTGEPLEVILDGRPSPLRVCP